MNRTDAVLRLVEDLGLRPPFLLAIDGRCAAGKTTLAGRLAKEWDCGVIHIDDFYLPFPLRTKEQMAQPGGNIDFDRLLREVILPLRDGRPAVWRPYDCHRDRFFPAQRLDPGGITIVEGAYSCHPRLAEYYSCRIFLDISPAAQLERIRLRDMDSLDAFLQTWIPREESYFESLGIRARCDLVL